MTDVARPEFLSVPRIYVIGVQQVNQGELTRFLNDHGFPDWTTESASDAETLMETGGRICYMSFNGGRDHDEYVDNIVQSRHGSVTEHMVWTLIFSGISRSLSLELLRHRVGVSPSQLSQRYVPAKDTKFIVPPDLQSEVDAAIAVFHRMSADPTFSDVECDTLLKSPHVDSLTAAEIIGIEWIKAMKTSRLVYEKITGYLAEKAKEKIKKSTEAKKYARQAARSVLPNATETIIQVTVNARALRHIVELRSSPHAEPEIQRLATMVYDAIRPYAPCAFRDFKKVPFGDEGRYALVTNNSKI